MKNRYFQDMMKHGIAYRQASEKEGQREFTPLYSVGKSAAFKFWSISQQYQCNDIIVDELPAKTELNDFLCAFREARIISFLVVGDSIKRINELLDYNCQIGHFCSVRRIIEIGYTATEVIEGIRIFL